MKAKWLTYILILSLAINGSVFATMGYYYYSQRYSTPPTPWPQAHGDHHFYQILALSDLQLAKMEPLAQAFHTKIDGLSDVMKKKNSLLIDLLSQKEPDPMAIEGLRREMADIQAGVQREVISHILESKDIFNAQQQQKFFELLRASMLRKKDLLFPPGEGQ